jgi:hypothetical protein
MIMDHLVQGSSGSWSHSCVRIFFLIRQTNAV